MSTCSWCLQRGIMRWLQKEALMQAQSIGGCCTYYSTKLPLNDSVARVVIFYLELVHDALGIGLVRILS